MTKTRLHALRPEEAADLLRGSRDVRVLDVRTPAEFEAAHIAGAINIPLDALGACADSIRDADTPILLVCQSGQRARRAGEVLGAAGLGGCQVIDGGLNAWTGAGLAVERGRTRISLERQVRIVAGAIAGAGGLMAAFVHPLFGLVPAFIGGGLFFAGVTNTCGMAMLLARLPYNRLSGTDLTAAVRALRQGRQGNGGTRASTGGAVRPPA